MPGELDFQLVFNVIPNPSLVVDTKLNIIAINTALEEQTHVKRANAVGKSLLELYPGNPEESQGSSRNAIEDAVNSAIVSKQPFAMAIIRHDIQSSEGTEFLEKYWSPVMTPIMNERGEVKFVLINSMDVTAYVLAKNSEDKLQAAELEVYKRSQELQNANQELESFCYSVSHDLRAPLRSISGFSQFLKEEEAEKLSDSGRDYLERIANSAAKMGNLIDALLGLSRLSRRTLIKTTVSLSNLAQGISRDLNFSNPLRKVHFQFPPDMQVEGDYDLLKTALGHMLQNAWKYTRSKESAQIEFGFKKEKDKKIYFIKDNGIGFNMEYSGKLFGAFQKLHPVKDFEGIGMGLAITQRIIHRHGGRIWAEGFENNGATFFFTLD